MQKFRQPDAGRVVLVRHGQDMDNADSLINGLRDTPLTALGKSQALSAADFLQEENIDCIYSSPLQRARQTAAIIAQRLGMTNVRVEPDLVERDYGLLTGRPVSEIPLLALEILLSHGFRYVIASPGIEDYDHLWTRAGNVLRVIQERHPGETVLIVAHNEMIKMIRANFEKRPWREELQLPPLVNGEVVTLRS